MYDDASRLFGTDGDPPNETFVMISVGMGMYWISRPAGENTCGFSINALSLFGLVLAIGIVVDDAIVVVENVERNMAKGLSPREAAYRTMEEVRSEERRVGKECRL